MTCQCRFINSNKCTIWWGVWMMGETVHVHMEGDRNVRGISVLPA